MAAPRPSLPSITRRATLASLGAVIAGVQRAQAAGPRRGGVLTIALQSEPTALVSAARGQRHPDETALTLQACG